NLDLNSGGTSLYIASNNTFSVEDEQGRYNACNYCVTIENRGFPSNHHPLPVPEPETYAMFLAGLIVMGYTLRRKKLV
ncbi:MAG: PEP-CTERM sorting domain-containing protein, partial [Nitrosomonas ureae]